MNKLGNAKREFNDWHGVRTQNDKLGDNSQLQLKSMLIKLLEVEK
jgi:DNA-binding winged helix-turn-helix (wHTH) protein